MMFELYTRYTLAMPKGTISEAGKRLIVQYIQAQTLQSGAWLEKNPENKYNYLSPLPEDWSWVWVVLGKGEYVGTFPKRVSKFYYARHGLKCPNEFLQQIGNLARSHAHDALEYTFEFVNRIDWQDGDFGDDGSCYWGGNYDARGMLEDNGGLAIRFYDENDKGMARAWVVPVDGFHIVFNGYGFVSNSTLTIARVMATFLGVSYKRISLSNHGSTTGTLWINGDRGYAVGAQETIEDIRAHDFEFGEPETRCDDCGAAVGDDYYIGADDNYYCDHCFYNHFGYCNVCDETFHRDDLTYVENRGDYCRDCLYENFAYCDRCDEWRDIEGVQQVDEEGTQWCASCRDDE